MPKRKTPVGSTFSHKTRSRLSRRLQRISQNPRLQRVPRVSKALFRVSERVKPKDRHAVIARIERILFSHNMNAERKLLGRLIGKPELGKRVAEKIKHGIPREMVLLLSQTKFIQKREAAEIIESIISNNPARFSDVSVRVAVARQLYNFYAEYPNLTSRIGEIIFKESAKFTGFGGNNPESREAFLSMLMHITPLYLAAVEKRKHEEFEVIGRITKKMPEITIELIIDGVTGSFSARRLPRPDEN